MLFTSFTRFTNIFLSYFIIRDYGKRFIYQIFTYYSLNYYINIFIVYISFIFMDRWCAQSTVYSRNYISLDNESCHYMLVPQVKEVSQHMSILGGYLYFRKICLVIILLFIYFSNKRFFWHFLEEIDELWIIYPSKGNVGR